MTVPFASTGYFLRVEESGCFLTNSYHFEDDSQIEVIYRVMSPGMKLRIFIRTNVYELPTNSNSWETFVQIINNVSGNEQVNLNFFKVLGFQLAKRDLNSVETGSQFILLHRLDSLSIRIGRRWQYI